MLMTVPKTVGRVERFKDRPVRGATSRTGPRAEDGTGLLTSAIVATLLLLLLLLASQTLLLLYRSSLAEAAAFDAASSLATKGGRSEDVDARTKELLGSTAKAQVLSEGDPVVVQVSLPSPGLLRLGPGGTKLIVRTAKVRREVFRPGGAPP
jgi:hypothetical protein